MIFDFEQLRARVARREATIGVVGMGYVGLPLALAAVAAGFRVVGFDVDQAKPQAVRAGRSYLAHIPDSAVAAGVAAGLRATDDFSGLVETDAILVCVPTPLTRHRDPDLSFVERTGETIAAHLRPGQLVVLESTTWPGTTQEVLRPILDRSGLVCGADYFLAFSPEREDPGNRDFETKTIAKVVGADDEKSRTLALTFYGGIVDKVVGVSTARAAEAAKLTENIFRAVNIALVNELKVVFDRMDIDVWEVIDAARTKPFGFMPFYPGPGLGGHCIPIDPFYLTWKAREYGLSTRFIELAGEINTEMPRYVVDRLGAALDRALQRGFVGTQILVVGVAYKKNIDDMRESPALTIIEMLEARGARVAFFDPLVPVLPPTREHPKLAGRVSLAAAELRAGAFAAAVVVTDHDGVDYAAVAGCAAVVVDTRNVFARQGVAADNIVKA